jgi:transmembrane sensor
MMKNNEYIFHILNKLEGDISPDDQQELQAWLEADTKNQEEYDLIAKIVSQGQQMGFPADPNVNEAWNKFEFPEDPLPKKNTYPQQWLLSTLEWMASFLQKRWLAYVALFIFIIGASAFWYHQSTHSIETITTANRQHKEITLSDGTIVYLNSGTELSYPRKFSSTKRQVVLKGEAFFEVAKAKSQFIVQTSEGTVSVLGTRFNIWARNLQTRVIVEEGLVRLAGNDISGNVILTKNLMSEISQDQPPSKPRLINPEELLGWRSGKLIFRHTMLSEIMGEIGRYYDIDIAIENPELKTKTMTAVFDRLPLNKLLYSICATLDIQYRYENGLYIFYKKNIPSDK